MAFFLFLLFLLVIMYKGGLTGECEKGARTGEPERKDEYAQPEDPWIKQAEHPADSYDGAKWERYYDAKYGITGSSPSAFPYGTKRPQEKTPKTSDESDSEPELISLRTSECGSLCQPALTIKTSRS